MESPSPTDGLRTRLRRQEVVTDLGRRALETDDPEGFLRDVAATVTETVGAEYCVVLESLPDGETGVCRASIGWEADRIGATVSTGPETHLGASLRADQPVVTDDPGAGERMVLPESLAAQSITSAVGVPIGSDDDPWGVLAVYATDRAAATDATVDFCRRVAALLEPAVENVRTRRDLAASKRRYRTLVESFPNGVVTLVDEDLTYRTVGGEPTAVAGVTAAEIEGESVRDAIPESLADELVPRYEAALEGESSSFEATSNGRVYDFHIVPVRDDGGEPTAAIGMSQDVTERDEYERQLAESEQRYRTLIDHFPNGAVGLFDEDLRYRIAGGDAFDEIGASADEIVGKTLWERYPSALAERLEPRFRAALEGETSSFELTFHDRDWTAYTLPVADDDGEIFGGMIMVQEITERKERERKLRERERQLERYQQYTDEILDAIDDVFYVIDADGDLQRWNESLTAVTGYPDEEIASMEPTDFFDGEDRTTAAAAIREGFETGSVSVEVNLATNDGDTVPFEFNATTLEDPQGNAVLAGIGRDVSDRVERQRRLEESERRYRTLAKHFPNGAVGIYDHDLTYTLAEGIELGETLPAADRLEGSRLPDRFPDHAVADLEPLFRAALEGETGDVQTEVGGRVWRVWATPLRDADGEIFAGLSFAQDVTEQVERENDLERYETIVEVVNDGVYVVDEDGYFTMVNETYAAMLGYDPSDLIGEHVSLVADETVIDRARELESDTAAGELPTIEAPIRTADGDTTPMEASFAMLPTDDSSWHRVGVARDISERKAWERELEESERRYRTLVENFPDGAVGLYDEALEYLVVGGEAFDKLGIAESEVIGTTLADRYPDDLVAEIEPHFRAVFDGESNTFEYRTRGRDVRAHTLPVRNEDGEIFAGMVMAQDVTERREYERKLEQSNERLEQFAYAASHDLQEPLRMITSYLTLLEQRYGDAFDEDGEEFLAYAVDGAERMREMIDGLLEYSRVETNGNPFEPTDLNAVLEDVLADLQVRIEETDAEVTIGDLPRLEADASQLRQVFQNLLENALTYSGDEPPRIRVDAERRGDEWEIAVRDEGIGIDSDDIDRVFTIFDRLHGREEYEGTGIGLALCERIVERHGGEITIDSAPGEGTTVSVVLPVSPE
ncbi:PAS domain S-box protein [Natrinema thermotolerans]